MRRAAVVAVLALVAAAVAAPAGAQTSLPVTLANGAGSRAMFIEDLLGNPLAGFQFGDAGSQPFRVRVVDTTMDPTPFTVSAQMTKLYLLDGQTPLATDPIASANLRIDPASALSVSGLSARVKPTVDVVLHSTDPVVCNALGLLTATCDVTLSGLAARVQAVPFVAADPFSALPLVPGDTGSGPFTSPAYTASSPDEPASPPSPTAVTLLSGSTNAAAGLLADLTARTQAVVTALPAVTDLVESSALVAAMPVTLQALSSATLTTLLGSDFTVTVLPLAVGQVLSQTGSYMSFPKLSVAVPPDAAKGSYAGTLIVTGIS